MAPQRINWVDSAKGIGILCVILGHTHVPMDVHTFIYSFHMPLFFLLSGLFLLKKQKTFKEELVGKARSLLVPYVLFNLLLLVFFKLLMPAARGEALQGADVLTALQGIVTGDRFHSWLWFLPCLFWAEMVLVACDRLHKNRTWLGLGLLGLGCLVNHWVGRPLPMSADNVLLAAGFISLGIWFRDHEVKGRWWMFVLLAAVYAVFAELSLDTTKGKGIEMYLSRYGNYAYFVLAALAAIFLILLLVRKAPDCKPLCWLGKNSLLIYCTHTMVLQIPYSVEKRLPAILPDKELQALLVSLLATVFVCLVSVPLSRFINRYTPWMLGRFTKPGA